MAEMDFALKRVFNKPMMYNEATLHRAITERQRGQALITVSNHITFLDSLLIPCRLRLENEFVRYKWGVGRLVADCKTDPLILPIYQLGLYDIYPKEAFAIPTVGRVGKPITIVVGEPIDVSSAVAEMRQRDASEEELRKYITDVIQDKMEQLAKRAHVVHYSINL